MLFLKIDAESFNCFETQSDAKTFICSSHCLHSSGPITAFIGSGMHHPPKPKKQDQLLTSPLGRCPRKKYSSGPNTASLHPSALKNSSSGPPTAFTRKIPVQDQYCLHCLRRAAPKKNSSSGPPVLPSPWKNTGPTTAFIVCGAQRPKKNSSSAPTTAFTVCGAQRPRKKTVQYHLLPSPRKVPVQDQYCLHCSRRAAPKKIAVQDRLYTAFTEKNTGPTTAFTVCGVQRPKKIAVQRRLLPSLFAARSVQEKIAVQDHLLPSLFAERTAQEK